MFHTIAFIGTGNMGSALAKAAARSERKPRILLANRTPEKAQSLAALLQAEVCDNRTAAREADLIFLCVKPQMMADMLNGIRDVLATRSDRFVLCTIAAGQSCERICEMLEADYPVIRCMPNTPVAIGKGVLLACSLHTSEKEFEDFEELMKYSGIIDRLQDKLINAASSVSGCGPAFAYMFAEALADGGVACGLPRDKALRYAAGMLEGAAALLLESGKHPGELKDAVCSPGGTTIQGVRKLEENGFRGAVMDAVIAANEKTLSLK